MHSGSGVSSQRLSLELRRYWACTASIQDAVGIPAGPETIATMSVDAVAADQGSQGHGELAAIHDTFPGAQKAPT